ncbi:helix-turn-helix transcriptional regulator, partial [Staphylococcus aureus]|uniref:helix-turn-helix transcriptional regulator n=3 Tax=Staphylococcus aureus TaxID=1280 RepID=UPI0039BE7E9E
HYICNIYMAKVYVKKEEFIIMINNIKYYRKKMNFSQQELANKVEVTRQTISLIELGKYNPTIKLCISIAKALQVDLNKLFWETSDNSE